MRQLIKTTARFVSMVLIAPLALPIWVLERFDRRDHLFQFGSHIVSLIPGLPGDYLRRAYYCWVLGAGSASIGFGTILAQRDTSIGERVYIGMFCNIGSSQIEDDVLIGSNVSIASPNMHNFDRLDIPISQQGGEISKIKIGAGSWLGNGSIVMSEVGKGVVIAAGSVVVKPCDDYGVYGGNPAKLIKHRRSGSECR